jgi:predicted nuclease of predicted toxin-antitoxin system
VKILIDMNLSPTWVAVFYREGWEAVHWSSIGKSNAPDTELLDWAAANKFILFTHDLDFGVLLASKSRRGPSVIQLRSQETSPAKVGAVLVGAIRQMEEELQLGALITIDPPRARARILPLL